jgi:hypothetical protein
MDQRICKQHHRTEGATIGINGRVPLQISSELALTYIAIANAITATVLNAQAGLEWLSAQPPDLEEVRWSLNSVANDGKRAAEVIVRLRALMGDVPTVVEVLDPGVGGSEASD